MKSLILSTPKQHAKKDFLFKLKLEKNAGKEWTEDYCEVLIRYLDTVHGVRVPADFPKQLKEAHEAFHSSKSLNISFNTIDSIVAACDLWYEYLSSVSDYDLLVSEEIQSMARINTSVIGAPYLNQIRELHIKKIPPFTMRTIVRKNGNGVQVIH